MFKDLKFTDVKPMDIELDFPKLTKKQKDLIGHKLYFKHAYRYVGAGIYTAIYGGDRIPAKQCLKRTRQLEYMLNLMAKHETYYLDRVTFRANCRVFGRIWPGGVKPEDLHFNHLQSVWLKKGEKCLIRVNRIDYPYHIDFERDNGQIFTVPYFRLFDFVYKGLMTTKRKEDKANEVRRKESLDAIKSRKGQSYRMVKRA